MLCELNKCTHAYCVPNASQYPSFDDRSKVSEQNEGASCNITDYTGLKLVTITSHETFKRKYVTPSIASQCIVKLWRSVTWAET
jgi:hypothetical protein